MNTHIVRITDREDLTKRFAKGRWGIHATHAVICNEPKTASRNDVLEAMQKAVQDTGMALYDEDVPLFAKSMGAWVQKCYELIEYQEPHLEMRELRRRMRLTQRQLAHLLDRSAIYVQVIEHGKTPCPKYATYATRYLYEHRNDPDSPVKEVRNLV